MLHHRSTIAGCPFTLDVITRQPDASKCVVRGEGLAEAISRKPQKFELEFVDFQGHVSAAEELEVYVEWAGGEHSFTPSEHLCTPSELTMPPPSSKPAELRDPTVGSGTFGLTSIATSAGGDGGMAMTGYRKLDQNARQRAEALWASRSSADKWLVKRAAEKQVSEKKKQ